MTGSAARSRSRPTRGLPIELTSFVGRRHELTELKRLLMTTRMLTLTGSGGAGKTRLALRAASDMARTFPDGVWFVPLGSVADPELVTQAVFNAVGLQDRSTDWSLSTLTKYLVEKRALLVLDNCEHLLDTCAVIAGTLLTHCPDLRVVATSRQALGLAGEVRLRVPPLSMPEANRNVAPAQLLAFDAVALLEERAKAVTPSFTIDDANAVDVLELCRRLDGMPLALELAAARLEARTVRQMNQALERELSVLRGGNRGAESRQQTLEATIAWSYGLLDEEERIFWARVSVFAGGFDEEAAIAVCADSVLAPDRISDLLAALIEKSILQMNPALRPPRYALLETLRQYGRARLAERGEEIGTQTLHRDWMLGLARAAGVMDRRQPENVNRISLERDNLWAALNFCLRTPGQAERGIEISRHLYVYWARDSISEVRRMVEALVNEIPSESVWRGRGLLQAAALCMLQGDWEAMRSMLEESLRLSRVLGDDETVMWAHQYLGFLAWNAVEFAEAERLLDSSLALARTLEDWHGVLLALEMLLVIRLSRGETDDAAMAFADEAMGISIRAGEHFVRGRVQTKLAQLRWLRGETQAAAILAEDAIVSEHLLGDRVGMASAVTTLAWIEAERGASFRAATLLGGADGLRESVGASAPRPFGNLRERTKSLVLDRIDNAAFVSAVDRGRAMDSDQVLAFAQDRKAAVKSGAAATTEPANPLTRREMEIARLIADGMTSPQIGAKLFISERTVESHVTNMLNKLGFNSRVQLARWVGGFAEPSRT